MEAGDLGTPIIALPERLDRRMRLGPFPSARDALKFFTYAATGALLAPFLTPWVWIPVVLVGFALSVWRPDGQSVEERAAAFLIWKLRNSPVPGVGRAVTPVPVVRQGLLQLEAHRYVAVIRTGGTPVAYLPPEELARRFEIYRDLLRSLPGSFSFLSSTAPIRSQSVRPCPLPVGDERTPAAGYDELVELLCRRRYLRRVYFVLGTDDDGSDAIGRLEGRISTLIETLGRLGLRATRLRDRPLSEAARRFGWPVRVGDP